MGLEDDAGKTSLDGSGNDHPLADETAPVAAGTLEMASLSNITREGLGSTLYTIAHDIVEAQLKGRPLSHQYLLDQLCITVRGLNAQMSNLNTILLRKGLVLACEAGAYTIFIKSSSATADSERLAAMEGEEFACLKDLPKKNFMSGTLYAIALALVKQKELSMDSWAQFAGKDAGSIIARILVLETNLEDIVLPDGIRLRLRRRQCGTDTLYAIIRRRPVPGEKTAII